jgi:hypothetical protein
MPMKLLYSNANMEGVFWKWARGIPKMCLFSKRFRHFKRNRTERRSDYGG